MDHKPTKRCSVSLIIRKPQIKLHQDTLSPVRLETIIGRRLSVVLGRVCRELRREQHLHPLLQWTWLRNIEQTMHVFTCWHRNLTSRNLSLRKLTVCRDFSDLFSIQWYLYSRIQKQPVSQERNFGWLGCILDTWEFVRNEDSWVQPQYIQPSGFK